MSAADVIATLVEAAIASSVAIVLVLLLRRPLRARFGTAIAYATWLLVPAALLAVLLPAAVAPAPVSMVVALDNAMSLPLAADAAPRVDRTLLWTTVWSLGALAMALYFATQQWRFRRALGVVQLRADGLQQAGSIRGLPAAFGLLRPRIVVPADFDHRYSAEQQALMCAHERSHIRAGDLHVNAFVAALRCLLWFNPLLHIASRHFRHDQELTCDQRVIERHPHSRRAYGEAMLKTQLAAQPLPLGCHWGYGHPLKERIEMLKQPVPTAARWAVGAVLTAGLILAGGTAAWAAQPARSSAVADDAGSIGRAEGKSGNEYRTPPPPPVPAAPPAPRIPPAPAPSASPPPPPPPPALPPPAYPAAAVAQKISGVVVLMIDIDARGRPMDIAVERSEPAGVFDQAAVDAAWKWTFTPEIEGGKPVASRVRVPVDFEIPPGTTGPGTPAGAA
ncbi:MAG: TonB family protein [Lysobacter sp.]